MPCTYICAYMYKQNMSSLPHAYEHKKSHHCLYMCSHGQNGNVTHIPSYSYIQTYSHACIYILTHIWHPCRFSKHKMMTLGREYSQRREVEQLRALLLQEQQARVQAESLCTTLQKKLTINTKI
jgi:hypothetical protein